MIYKRLNLYSDKYKWEIRIDLYLVTKRGKKEHYQLFREHILCNDEDMIDRINAKMNEMLFILKVQIVHGSLYEEKDGTLKQIKLTKKTWIASDI